MRLCDIRLLGNVVADLGHDSSLCLIDQFGKSSVPNAQSMRIDLICELAQNGLSDRAKELAKSYGKRGTEDPYIESLLQRFGG